MTAIQLPLQLLRLVSPLFPVGAFAYSRGLEWAVQAGSVRDEETARSWIFGVFAQSYAQLDAPLFWRMMQALDLDDAADFRAADDWLASSRESRELQAEDRRMAEALCRLLAELGPDDLQNRAGPSVRSYPAAFALAAKHAGVPAAAALAGLMWSVVEGQVAAAMRLVPLGQTAGQRLLAAAPGVVAAAAARAMRLADEDIGNVAPGLAMASAWHETQYSRLFQS